MWEERLKRILIIIGVAGLMVFGGQAFARWSKKQTGEPIQLPGEVVTSKFEEIGEDVLGKAVEILPGSSQLKEKVVEKETQKTTTNQEETTKIIETQTKEIIEIIKELPQDQIDQLKKQVFKDFCQEVLKE